MSSNTLESFDHPCKTACSGWRQGFDRGHSSALSECNNLNIAKQMFKANQNILDIQSKINKCGELLKIQYDSTTPMDDYQTGMYNGMEMILSILGNREPNYKDVEFKDTSVDVKS